MIHNNKLLVLKVTILLTFLNSSVCLKLMELITMLITRYYRFIFIWTESRLRYFSNAIF